VKEDFLHYIWKHKLLNLNQLETTQKEKVQLINSGEHNHNAGPDFFNSQIIIEDLHWAGNIEIHVKSSDWYVHGHEKDINYDSIILHVVWEHDIEIYTKDNLVVPTLELKKHLDKNILNNYQKLFSKSQKWINCQNVISSVDPFIIDNWLERLYVERLEQKSELTQKMLDTSHNDWEAVLIKLLFKNFGLKVNGDAFLNLINSIDFSIIRKEKQSLVNIEALLFGQAGLLSDDIQDAYYKTLQMEYNYLLKKHNLQVNMKSQFQFFRLRPNNFPTVRIAQLAALLNQHQNLFSKIIATTKLKDYYKLFDISISEFWKIHYSFTSTSRKTYKKLSKKFIDLLLINTIVPLKFIYLKYINELNEEELISTIKLIKPEKNVVIDGFKELNVPCNNALNSQALLQLKNEYCEKNKCIQCAIGNQLLRI
jgi:hypothetical protein